MHQFEHKRIDVAIKWQKPVSLEEVSEIEADKCKDTYFYKIIGRHNNNFKLFYIGKCIEQYVTTRIFQKDHLIKQADFKEAHKKHKLLVSFGNLSEEQKLKPTELSNVESLLIYSHTHDDFSYIKNKQCSLSHNVIKNYRIINSGWREEGMYKIVAYGLFVRS
ncbi:hypothetical protein D0C36_20015 [Mucilaginibacter conchicola]|uniref:Uncharacterized protein n=1 Tax=Mucilaginibacter conchicola TaxID=2303333 RepID=A0A372NQK9_9SPHI|nr:hypothetical protein [Mucilaginibacter conchicola]RFZ91224.1 hypothetical protein D0C36_20015 [Mucilaginibacter conchicola]